MAGTLRIRRGNSRTARRTTPMNWNRAGRSSKRSEERRVGSDWSSDVCSSDLFSPLAMINGWYIANPPWKQQNRKKNNANELEPGWEKLEEIGRASCRE